MKKGLVIEGGGMRSAYAAGALAALHDFGLRDFDVVVGTSAGACCAVNFVGGYPLRNLKILQEYLSNDRFIRYSKVLSRENIVDIDFLLDEVIGRHVPLPLQEVKSSPTRLYIAATDCHSGKPTYFNVHQNDVVESLRASCAMPYLYKREVLFNDHRFIDGGVSVSIPVHKTLEEGCSEIWVIGTRPLGYRKKRNPVAWLNYLFFPKYPNMVKAMNDRWKEYNSTLEWLENPPPDKKVIVIRPKGRLPLTRTTRDPVKIQAGFQMGYDNAAEILREQGRTEDNVSKKGINERGDRRPLRQKDKTP